MTFKFYTFLLILIFCPTLNVGGHYINLAEFYVYILFFINIKIIRKNTVAMIFIKYALLFFLVVLFTAFLAKEAVNNHDIFIIRNCLQLVCSIFIFQHYCDQLKKKMSDTYWQIIFYRAIFILSIPALLVFLQRIDFLGFRDLMIMIYQPKFHFLTSDLFEGHRYTSIFKDFFTSSVYFIVLSLALVTFYLRTTLPGKFKLSLILLLLLIYISQFYVARTSVIFIPLMSIICFILSRKQSFTKNIRTLSMVMLLSVPLFAYLEDNFSIAESINAEWASEGVSSFEVMQTWNTNFYEYLFNNPDILLRPRHVYDLVEGKNSVLYTDSFYPQEIYRYGIYGMIPYLYMVLALIFTFFKTERGLMIITLCLIFLNYKGGNVFFMPKDIYLLAFIFSWFSRWKYLEPKVDVLA